jgi:hypothetical protein
MTKTPETRLAHASRALVAALKVGEPSLETINECYRLEQAAAQLDLTCVSLGAKGERVKSLVAYRACLRQYNKLSPKPYEEPKK